MHAPRPFCPLSTGTRSKIRNLAVIKTTLSLSQPFSCHGARGQRACLLPWRRNSFPSCNVICLIRFRSRKNSSQLFFISCVVKRFPALCTEGTSARRVHTSKCEEAAVRMALIKRFVFLLHAFNSHISTL